MVETFLPRVAAVVETKAEMIKKKARKQGCDVMMAGAPRVPVSGTTMKHVHCRCEKSRRESLLLRSARVTCRLAFRNSSRPGQTRKPPACWNPTTRRIMCIAAADM